MSEPQDTEQQVSPEYSALADRLRAVEAQLADERNQTPATAESDSGSDYLYSGLTVSAKHEPDYSTEFDAYGNKEQVELPGFMTFGVEVEGEFVPLLRRKAGKLLKKIAQAKNDSGTEQTPNG